MNNFTQQQLDSEIWIQLNKNIKISSLGRVSTKNKGIHLGSINGNGYYSFNIKPKTKDIHRVVAETFILNPENKTHVDHINGIKTDNKIENLRWVSHRENLSFDNKSISNTKRVKSVGVCWHPVLNKYFSKIVFNKKTYHLGLFDREGDARNIYDEAVEKGEQFCIDLLILRQLRKTSKYKGVSLHKASKKFVAQITINKKRKNLGLFETEEKAYEEILKTIKNEK